MGRKATPRVWREWFVTEAGGRGMRKLCLRSKGDKKATEEMDRYLKQVTKERDQEIEAGIVQADSPYKISHLAAEFLQYKKATKKQSTCKFYQKSLQRLVDWYGQIEARKLKFTDSSEFILPLREEALGNVSINHLVQAAKTVLNFGVDISRLPKNPWKKTAKLPQWGRKRLVTDDEFQKLLTACEGCINLTRRYGVSKEENVLLMKDILRILRFTAMRPGELRKLRWSHIKEKFIVIPASDQKTGTTAKVPQDRIIPILDEATAILLARREKYGHQDRVFSSITGDEWSDQRFSQRFARLRKRAGLDRPDENGEMIVAYSLRHTRLTEAATTEEWDLFSLMTLAGHTTAQMTSKYIHQEMKSLSRVAMEGQLRLQASKQKKD